MNEQGESLAARRLPEGPEGMTALHELLAEHAPGEPAEVVIGIETDRGPWVTALLGAGYLVYAINPRAASRYRERHQVGGGKSDSGDARMLTQPRPHRPPQPPPGRRRQHGSLRCAGARPRPAAARLEPHAREQPAPERAAAVLSGRAPRIFPDLTHRDALSVLAIAPEPGAAARLTVTQLRSALRRGGRIGAHVERRAAEIRAALRVRTLEVTRPP